jgi:hypothetical protein
MKVIAKIGLTVFGEGNKVVIYDRPTSPNKDTKNKPLKL